MLLAGRASGTSYACGVMEWCSVSHAQRLRSPGRDAMLLRLHCACCSRIVQSISRSSLVLALSGQSHDESLARISGVGEASGDAVKHVPKVLRAVEKHRMTIASGGSGLDGGGAIASTKG